MKRSLKKIAGSWGGYRRISHAGKNSRDGLLFIVVSHYMKLMEVAAPSSGGKGMVEIRVQEILLIHAQRS